MARAIPDFMSSIVTRPGVFDVPPVFSAAATAARMSCSVFVCLPETRIFMKPFDLDFLGIVGNYHYYHLPGAKPRHSGLPALFLLHGQIAQEGANELALERLVVLGHEAFQR